MTPHPPHTSPHPIPPELARRTLTDLGREATALADTLECARQVRAALLGGDTRALTAALERQERAAQTQQAANVRRHHLRQEWANALEIGPEAVTLTALACRFSEEDRAQLGRLHERLFQLARAVDEMNRGNALIADQCRDFLNGFLVELTGGQDGGRYGPRGGQVGVRCGSLIEARG